MIRRLIRQMLAAQTLSALTVSLCLLIDNIMISRFLGETAVAAYGLSNPLLLIIGAIATLLSSGIQVTCSKSLGKGSQEETNEGYSSAIAVALVISVLFTAAVLLFRHPLAYLAGARTGGQLFDDTQAYLAGFSLGAPGSMGALVLLPFMQMAGQSNLLIVAVLAMTVSDVALDLLNALVFHGGMFGMGLASSLSYYAALLVAGSYFLSKRCVFRFSLSRVRRAKIAELLRSGLPAGVGMAASVVFVFAMNQLMQSVGGSGAVAAFTVVQTIANSANCITTGIGGVSLTLSGILFHEEDRTGLKELFRQLFRWAVILGLLMGAALLLFAPALIGVFLPEPGPTQTMAILGLRVFSLGLIPCCMNAALKNAYQSTGRVLMMEIVCLLEGAALPLLAGAALSALFGFSFVWLYFAAGELLTLIGLGLYIRRKTRKLPWRDGAYLLLKDDFSVPADRLMELDIHSMEEVASAAQRAEEFCRSHGHDSRISSHIGLCIEEMAGNTIQHGFSADQKPHHLSVRILAKPDAWILRFRDDCTAFDPVHYVPGEGQDALGIRLVLGMAREAHYTYSLNLNNLTIKV